MTQPKNFEFRWAKKRTPTIAVAEMMGNAPIEVALAYVRFLKRTARGHLRDTHGHTWPVDTGRSRDRFKIVGRTRFKKNVKERQIPESVFMIAEDYAFDVDRYARPRVTQRVFRRFARSGELDAAMKKTSKQVNRIRAPRV